MNKKREKLVVGQTLWWVPFGFVSRSKPGLVTVTKVGRVWAELSNRHRIGVVDWMADSKGFSSPGHCYVSKEEYDTEEATHKVWTEFQRRLCHLCPPHLTIADINDITKRIFPEDNP